MKEGKIERYCSDAAKVKTFQILAVEKENAKVLLAHYSKRTAQRVLNEAW